MVPEVCPPDRRSGSGPGSELAQEQISILGTPHHIRSVCCVLDSGLLGKALLTSKAIKGEGMKHIGSDCDGLAAQAPAKLMFLGLWVRSLVLSK